jgi:hypothetical protein
MSRLRANQITNENANGAPNFPHGLTVTGIVTATTTSTTLPQIVVGSAVTANSQGIDVTGIVTATSFKGDGSNLTGIDASSIKNGSDVKVQANASGAVVTGILTATGSPGAGIGKIIQIVQAFKKDTQYVNTQSFVDLAGLNPSITPIRTGSKILVHYEVQYAFNGDAAFLLQRSIAGGSYAYLNDYRGDLDSSTSANAERCLFGSSGPAGGYDIHTSSGYILDDPSYTLGQSIAYKFQFCSPHHGSYYIRINGGQTVHNSNYDKRVISYMTLMEVG